MLRIFLAACCLPTICLLPVGLRASEEKESMIGFNRDIRPILSENCFQCHGPDSRSRKGDLRLDRFENEGTTLGAESVIERGDANASELVRRIESTDHDERMPPVSTEISLTKDQIQRIRDWVEQDGAYENHWAFSAPERPNVPSVARSNWPKNPIDNFVLKKLQAADLRPSTRADEASLLRRLSLDLIGLPPESETLATFREGPSSSKYETLVEQLLKSPRYGEHWATMWLDAARYADTNGYNNDTPRYNWPYRDWLIKALNDNMPYDQFIIEQLAGDLLPNATQSQQVATGFNRNHNVTSEGGIVDEEYRLEYVADRVHTTSTVFMALTLRCARCHDHKFDPISQKEYYQFFAFFNQVPETGYHKEHVGNPNPVIKLATSEQSRELTNLSVQLQDLEHRLKDQKSLRDESERARLVEQKKQLEGRRKKITRQMPTAMVMRDQEISRDTFVLTRGAYDQRAEKVANDVPGVLPDFPKDAERNRLGFAKWLTSRNHPLTARVIVNRLWAEIFGHGLVETLEDFGTQGALPSHPQLLDWMAVELIESGWDVQHVLRLIVSSATYQQSSRTTTGLQQSDPNNRLYARGPRFRMKAEVIRDSALSVSGLLVNKIGGPSVRPYQPSGLWVEVAVADDNYSGGPYVQSQGDDLYRRSLYTWWKRTCPPPNLNTLDAPEREFCRVQRSRTNTPLQALVLMNDPIFVEAARKLAERMIRVDKNPTTRIQFGFRLVTAREANAEEIELLLRALNRFRARFADQPDLAEKLLSVGDSPRAVDAESEELAAYTAISNMLLNLDEFVTK